ncbi:MAG: leucine-rich repeat protein [Muribaculaceae bacterium]|nr:leucine-rich repeat protein [Muribaculaceae bacterium]
MKKLIPLLFAMMAIVVQATTYEYNNLKFSSVGSGSSMTLTCTGVADSWNQSTTALTIPGYVYIDDVGKFCRVKTIGMGAFQGMTTITSVRMQYGIENIYGNAFNGCTSLKIVYLPSSIKQILIYAFRYAPITSIYCAAESMPSINNDAFTGMAAVSGSRTWYEPSSTGVNAANGANLITSNFSVLKSNLASDIGVSMGTSSEHNLTTFYCNVTSQLLDQTTTSNRGRCKLVGVGGSIVNTEGIVNATTSVASVNGLYYNITSIGSGACQNGGLTALDLTALTALDTICDYAFSYCYDLASVALPDNLKRMSTYCFGSCTSLTSITIPRGVTYMPYTNVFQNCSALTAINVDPANTSYSSLNGALYNKAQTTLYKVPEAWNGYEMLSGYAYFSLPYTVQYIASYAFSNNTTLEYFAAFINLKSIGSYIFSGCSKLIEVTFTSGLYSWGNYVFKDCTALNYLSVNSPTPPTINVDQMFSGVPTYSSTDNYNVRLYVPYGMEAAYKAAGWTKMRSYNYNNNIASDWTQYLENNGSTTGRMSLTVTSTAPVTIEGTQYDGRMRIDYLDGSYSYVGDGTANNVKVPASLTINDKTYAITCLGSNAIYHCNYVTGCELIDTVKYCTELMGPLWRIELPYASHIADSAFAGARTMPQIKFGKRLRTIGYAAFRNSGLTQIFLPYGVESIGDYAFAFDGNYSDYYSNWEHRIKIPSSVTQMGENVLKGRAMEEITINNARWAGSDVSFDLTNIPDTCLIFVPYSATETFKAHPSWARFAANIYPGGYDIYDDNTKACYTMVDPQQNNVKLVFRAFNHLNMTNLDYSSHKPTDANYGGEYNLTELDQRCLANTHNLETLVLPECITTIPEGAFFNSDKLTHLIIPANVTYIDSKAMAFMAGLQTLQCDAVTPPSLGSNVWMGVNQSAVTLTVPNGSQPAYKAAQQWKEFYMEPTTVLGDVTGEGDVDVSDVNAVINIILNKKTQEDYPGSADVTGEGTIDVSDVNAIINIILNKV